MSVNDIWVATDHADSPIRAYNPSGSLTYASDVVSSPRGLAFSYETGHRTIWASDPITELIYQIDMDPTGIEEGQTGSVEVTGLSASSNPVAGAVTFTGTGFAGNAVIEVYGLSGRLVLSEPFGGVFSWNGTAAGGDLVPAGVYIAVVRDDSGGYAAVTVTRLRP